MAISTKINPEFGNLPLNKLLLASFIISAITAVLGLLAQIVLPLQIPLYYGLPQTTAQITPSILIVLPSVVSIFTTIINTILSIKIHDNYLKRTLAFASITVAILAVVTTYKIIFLVGSL